MKLDAIPVFATLKSALGYHADRARVLAENIANVDTPDFRPRDIAGGDVAKALGVDGAGALTRASSAGVGAAVHAPLRTHGAHLSRDESGGMQRTWRISDAHDSERTHDGNAVVVEEQIAQVSENRAAYEAAVSLYQKSLGLLRMAARTPGG